MLGTRNEHKSYIALCNADNQPLFVNPAQVTHVTKVNDSLVRIHFPNGDWVNIGGDIDEVAELLEEGLV